MENDIVNIGMRECYGGNIIPVGIDIPDRRQHVYCIGKSGTGKTTLLQNLIVQDIQAGRGVGLLDPHGDLAEDILNYVPRSRTSEVVYFNPTDQKTPIGFNILDRVPRHHRPRVASGVVEAFKHIWADSWGPRLEHLLYNAVSALLDHEHSTLLGLSKIFTDAPYREQIVRCIKDPFVKQFWEVEFAGYDKRFRTEAIAPIQNKVGQFLADRTIRNILGQTKTTLNFRKIMDGEKIFIANLAKGSLGESKANLLGSLLTTQFQLAAMSRADTKIDSRKDFHLYIDEFHNFSTDSFASILSEARKYRLSLTLAHQYIEQLSPAIQSAVFGNVGTIISFRLGNRDTEALALEFQPEITAQELVDLDRYTIAVKLLNNGEHQAPFKATTFDLGGDYFGRSEQIKRNSRRKFCIKRRVIEDRIERWMRR